MKKWKWAIIGGLGVGLGYTLLRRDKLEKISVEGVGGVDIPSSVPIPSQNPGHQTTSTDDYPVSQLTNSQDPGFHPKPNIYSLEALIFNYQNAVANQGESLLPPIVNPTPFGGDDSPYLLPEDLSSTILNGEVTPLEGEDAGFSSIPPEPTLPPSPDIGNMETTSGPYVPKSDAYMKCVEGLTQQGIEAFYADMFCGAKTIELPEGSYDPTNPRAMYIEKCIVYLMNQGMDRNQAVGECNRVFGESPPIAPPPLSLPPPEEIDPNSIGPGDPIPDGMDCKDIPSKHYSPDGVLSIWDPCTGELFAQS